MLVANRQDAGGNRGRQRRAIAGRGQARGCARGRARSVIGARHENGVDQSALGLGGQLASMQQEERVHEPSLTHELGDVVPANPDVRLVRVDDGRAPGVHAPIMPPSASSTNRLR
jgi:hypothetical protein